MQRGRMYLTAKLECSCAHSRVYAGRALEPVCAVSAWKGPFTVHKSAILLDGQSNLAFIECLP